jgi:hypothetical protein
MGVGECPRKKRNSEGSLRRAFLFGSSVTQPATPGNPGLLRGTVKAPDWFTELALAVVRNMDYGTPFTVHVEALWLEVEKRMRLNVTESPLEAFPWSETYDQEHDIETQRQRYWNTQPYSPKDRDDILKRWTPGGD